jgi:transcriptional regulator with XRE-family HTH domain
MKQVAEINEALKGLGRRLRRARLERNDSMTVFAQRIGVSEQTVRAMERGLPTVKIGTWLEALWVLNGLEPLDRLLEKRESLLDIARREERARQRLRASRRGK